MIGKAFDEEWSPNTQPIHGGKSPGSHGLQIDFCNRTWGCVVSGVCGDWQRGTHVDGRVMEATTSATHPHQPQATHHWRSLHHITLLNAYTHRCAYPHGCMVVERAEDHTVLTIAPSIHPNHTLHHQPRAGQHPYSTLHPCRILASLGKKGTRLCASRVP